MITYTWDIETYPNIFSIGIKNFDTGEKLTYEYSWRRNDIPQLIQVLSQMKLNGDRLVGFNNVGFDYPVIHYIIENQGDVTPLSIYNKAMSIINCDWNRRWDHA
jgi:hypothetical protein